MKKIVLYNIVVVLLTVFSLYPGVSLLECKEKKPTILIATLARNKGHTLPYFLTLIQNLDYPKDRISLW